MSALDIESYAARHVHVLTAQIPPLLGELVAARGVKSYADLGCGDGNLLDALLRQGRLKGKTVYAVDLSSTRIARVQSRDPALRCIVADVAHVPQIPDGSIDVICSTQVIEHVIDESKMIAELFRLLAPGGSLYLTTVFKKWYGWYFYRCNGRWTLDPTHLREYTADVELVTPLERQGFVVEVNRKTPLRYALVDLTRHVLRAESIGSRGLAKLRRFECPVPGYLVWELVCRKSL